MTEAVQDQATETTAAPATKPGRVAASLTLVTPAGESLKAIKYPMPLKAPRFKLSVNGQEVDAAQTTFRDIKYTYFEFGEASFYVPGHLSQYGDGGDKLAEYTFKFPEGYTFKPIKLDRKAQAEAAAKAKAAKDAPAEGSQEADAAPVQADAADETAGEGVGSEAGAEAPAAAPKKGRKVSR